VDLPLNTLLLAFGGPWSIEVAFAQAKQPRGLEEPPSRSPLAVPRLLAGGLLLLSLVKFWYVTHGMNTTFAHLHRGAWNRGKSQAAFSDRLAAVRRAGWTQRFKFNSASHLELQEIVEVLVDRLARAA
jgi:hypothetical protein